MVYLKKNGEIWLLESKSTKVSTPPKNGPTHALTIGKSYNGLKDMLAGGSGKTKSEYDPWTNAAHHVFASHSKDHKSLRIQLDQLSKDYLERKYETIDKCNVIIASTVVCDDLQTINVSIDKLNKYIETHESKEEIISLLDLQNEDIFYELLDSILTVDDVCLGEGEGENNE